MKYAESKTAQRRVNGNNVLHLKDIADQPISITSYEQRRTREDDRPFLILTVVLLTERDQRTVKVTTSAAIVMERVLDFFAAHPTNTLEAIITRRTSGQGWEYWVIVDPDQYERQRAQGRTVRYPTQQERLVHPRDVAAKVDRMEDIPF